jgi:hypothetical protein
LEDRVASIVTADERAAGDNPLIDGDLAVDTSDI